jgi:Protein of unknown function (DUF3072)
MIPDPAPPSNTEKEPEDWISGGDLITAAEASYLKTLSEEWGAPDAVLGTLDQSRNASTR